jgi:hypothetical protein
MPASSELKVTEPTRARAMPSTCGTLSGAVAATDRQSATKTRARTLSTAWCTGPTLLSTRHDASVETASSTVQPDTLNSGPVSVDAHGTTKRGYKLMEQVRAKQSVRGDG